MTVTLPMEKPAPTRGGLADNVRPLEANGVSVPVSEWREGVQYTPQCETNQFIWGCGRHEGDPKPIETLGGEDQLFLPGTIGSAASCGVGGMHTLIGNHQKTVAAGGLERNQWQQVADILYTGNVGIGTDGTDTPNPGFFANATVSDNQDYVNPGSIAYSAQLLLEGYCGRWSGDVLIHVPQQFKPLFVEQHIVELDSGTNRYLMGEIPVSFDCYQNLGPEAADDRTPATDGTQFWMYMSSVPMVSMDEVDVYDYIDARQNSYTVVAERGAIAVYDVCAVSAALSSIYPTTVPAP